MAQALQRESTRGGAPSGGSPELGPRNLRYFNYCKTLQPLTTTMAQLEQATDDGELGRAGSLPAAVHHTRPLKERSCGTLYPLLPPGLGFPLALHYAPDTMRSLLKRQKGGSIILTPRG